MAPSVPALLDAVMSGVCRSVSPLHGEEHWARVAFAGLAIAEMVPDVDPVVTTLFALLHDSRRLDDEDDPEHGPRAAELADELCASGLLVLSERRRRMLKSACEGHSFGRLSSCVSVSACWDADRTELRRYDVDRRPEFFAFAFPYIAELDAAVDVGAATFDGWERLISVAEGIGCDSPTIP